MTHTPHTLRRLLAALFTALGLTALGAGAAAAADPGVITAGTSVTAAPAADPGLTHNGTDMHHN